MKRFDAVKPIHCKNIFSFCQVPYKMHQDASERGEYDPTNHNKTEAGYHGVYLRRVTVVKTSLQSNRTQDKTQDDTHITNKEIPK